MSSDDVFKRLRTNREKSVDRQNPGNLLVVNLYNGILPVARSWLISPGKRNTGRKTGRFFSEERELVHNHYSAIETRTFEMSSVWRPCHWAKDLRQKAFLEEAENGPVKMS